MTPKVITSSENAVFKSLRDLHQTKGVKKHGLFLVFGERAVRDTIAHHPSRVRDVLICDGQTAPEDLIRILRANGEKFSLLSLSRPLFDELDLFGTNAPMIAVQVQEIPEANLAQAPEGLEILCALSDPSNLGALIRSAAAFGIARIVLLKESASPYHPRAVRAASASTLLMTFSRGPSIKDVAAAKGPIIALDMKGAPLGGFKWPKDARLLLGEEGLGVPRENADFLFVSIPMEENVESLNATVAASIAMYSYRLTSQR